MLLNIQGAVNGHSFQPRPKAEEVVNPAARRKEICSVRNLKPPDFFREKPRPCYYIYQC